ncbi:MAG: hypothetical protein QOG10_4744 [Kribbellaceae bacterium]|nr:hypothetical protein [Kribbellaceae bacterium]
MTSAVSGLRALTPARTRVVSGVPRLMPWLIPLVIAVVALHTVDVPVATVARYALYFAGCVVLPGVLLMRAVWRSTGNWAEDVGLGAAVGFGYELAGWALFTALGWQSALVVWPLLVPACFAAVPKLRQNWRIAEPAPLPVLWSWGVALCVAVLVAALGFGTMADNPLPPAGTFYYPDLLYHLSMVNELVRAVPPELPQVAGNGLDYHWFADAQMAAGIDVSRASAAQVLLRLWPLPVSAVAVLVCAALGRQVSKVWWTGVLVPVLLLPAQLMLLYPASALDLAAPLAYLSPSQSFGLVTGTAAAVFLIEALFRGGGRGAWVLAVLVAIIGGGAKPTTLPILIGGVGLAAVFVLVRDRRIPWRLVLAGTLLVGTAVVTMLTVAGSTSGSGFQLFAMARYRPGYQQVTGDMSLPATGGWLLPSLASGDKVAIAGGLVEVTIMVLIQVLLLAGFAVLLVKKTRTNPIAWWLVGALTAGWLGMLLVDHPSASEGYFLRSAVPFGAAAAAWLAAVAVRGQNRRTAVVVSLSGLVIGGLVVAVGGFAQHDPVGSRADRIQELAQPVLLIIGLLLLVLTAWLFLVRRHPALGGLGLALLVFVPVGISGAFTAGMAWAARDAPPYYSSTWRIYPDEQAAALWLGSHSQPDDVVVTNTACLRAAPQLAGCDARGYLVSGLAGRRTLIEGWAYTEQAMARQGVDGRRYTVQPSPWPDRTALTKQVLAAPTAELLDRLYRDFGVRWIYADGRDGKVSPDLGRLALLRYERSRVRIYQLPAR